MSSITASFEAVLDNPAGFPWNHSVYASFDETWELDTLCIICDPDEEEDIPAAARALGYERVLSIGDFDMIRSNAVLQKPNATPQDLLNAFHYYYDNDAYINFAHTP